MIVQKSRVGLILFKICSNDQKVNVKISVNKRSVELREPGIITGMLSGQKQTGSPAEGSDGGEGMA